MVKADQKLNMIIANRWPSLHAASVIIARNNSGREHVDVLIDLIRDVWLCKLEVSAEIEPPITDDDDLIRPLKPQTRVDLLFWARSIAFNNPDAVLPPAFVSVDAANQAALLSEWPLEKYDRDRLLAHLLLVSAADAVRWCRKKKLIVPGLWEMEAAPGAATSAENLLYRPKASKAAVFSWFAKRVAALPADQAPPTRDEDERAAKTHFGGYVPRDLVRKARAELAAGWGARGRRKKTGKG
jgi:hypothetical protein